MLLGISHVAAEQLVSAVPAKHSCETIVSGHTRAIVSGYCRRVAKRLIENRCRFRNGSHYVIRGNIVFPVSGREMFCRNTRVFHFVITRRIEAYGIGPRRLTGYFPEYARNCRAVGATAEERTNLFLSHRFTYARMQHIQKIPLQLLKGTLFIFYELHFPVPGGLDRPLPKEKILAWQKAALPRVNCLRSR